MKEKRIIINGKETDYLVRDDGTVWSEKRKRQLKGTLARNEYHTIYLFVDGKQINPMMHRLVAEAFCSNPNNYKIVHHINGNKLDNRAENLEWVSESKNSLEKKKTARKPHEYLPSDYVFDKDIWRDVFGFEKSFIISRDGKVVNKRTLMIMAQSDRNGYKRVKLSNTYCSVHRLVYYSFNPTADTSLQIDHIDGNRSNNLLENLRAVTMTENALNSVRNGHKGQIPIYQLDDDKKILHEYSSIQEAAKAMDCTHGAIRHAIVNNKKSKGFYWIKKKDYGLDNTL